MNGLMVHTPGSQMVTLDHLRNLPTPEARGARHQPIPHHELVDTLTDQILDRGWDVTHTQMGTAASGKRLFGTMKLRGPGNMDAKEMNPTLGFRSSTDSALSIRMVVGATVFVCDNLCFSGDEFVLRRKSTTGLFDLPGLINGGLDRFMGQTIAFERDVDRMKDAPLGSDEVAKSRLFDIFNMDVLPLHLLPKVSELYFQPDEDHTDCHPRSLWGLNNACTRSIHQLKKPAAKFSASQLVGRHFNSLIHPEAEVRLVH